MTDTAPVRRAWRAGAASVVLLAAAAASLASMPEALPERGLLRISESPPFVPGQVVHLAWDPLPPDVEEFEILVVAEFPRPLRLRLTESEEACRRSLTVSIPTIAPCSARFLLRAGSLRGEFLFAESESWRLESPPGGPVAPVVEKGGELWVQEGSSGEARWDPTPLPAGVTLPLGPPPGTPPESQADPPSGGETVRVFDENRQATFFPRRGGAVRVSSPPLRI